MAITPQQLADAFNAAGLDTAEKVEALLAKAAPAIRVVEIDRLVERKRREQQAAAAEAEAEIQALQVEAARIRAEAAALVSG